MPIVFNEGLANDYDNQAFDARVSYTRINNNVSESFFTEQHPFYEFTPYLGQGALNIRIGNGSYSGNSYNGTYEGFYKASITWQTLHDWAANFPGKALPVISIPFETLTTHIRTYLIFAVKITSISVSGPAYNIDFSSGLYWCDKHDINDEDATVEEITGLLSRSSGTMQANFNRWLSFDCSFVRDAGLADQIDLSQLPLADMALIFKADFRTWPQSDVDHPSNIAWSTNAAGNINTRFLGLKQAAPLHGWPFWEDVSPEVGPPSDAGGYDPSRPGAFDDTSNDIALPGDPSLGVSNVGFVRVYNTGLNELTALGLELFPPLSYTPPAPISDNQSVSEAIVDGFNQIVTFLANIPSFFDQFMANTLINYVIDCHMIPVSPGAGSSESIHVGPKTLTTTAGRIYTDYVNVSCGSISVGEYYGNFADYYANAKLYLPFVGFVPTRPEWFTGSTLSVDYKFNIIDGSFCCYVRAGGKHVGSGGSTIVAQYAGTACVHLPITGPSYAAMVSGLVGAGAGMIAGAASGNIAAVATSAIGAMTSHGDIASSNAYNGSAAFLSCRYPFLMIERPVSSWARNYQHEIGIPANVYATLSDVMGFCTMENVHVDGISGATETEKAEIKRLLAQGVIV